MVKRSEIIEKLIIIRRGIDINTRLTEEKKLQEELDELIFIIIGNFLNRDDKTEIRRIMDKVYQDEISVTTAMVAIKEIVFAYFSGDGNEARGENRKSSEKPRPRSSEEIIANHYYEKGYR
ncbi:MAG TPA: hypothetical protein VKY40_09410 [Halanaerobiales bacterium]|nr:hypothetical protein [Halanaerobiales bacterium]